MVEEIFWIGYDVKEILHTILCFIITEQRPLVVTFQ